MSTRRIFQDFSLTVGNSFELTANATHHLSCVLRVQMGEQIILFNGQGGEYRAVITAINKKKIVVQVIEFSPLERESLLQLHLGQVISRGERMDYTIQKAVELGATTITPLFSERCTVKLTTDRLANRLAHWQNIIISACEQCGRNRLPILTTPASLFEWVKKTHIGLCLILDPHGQEETVMAESPTCINLLVGSEGGLSAEEIDAAQQQGFKPLKLGPRILRTETAAVTALAICQYQWGDFK